MIDFKEIAATLGDWGGLGAAGVLIVATYVYASKLLIDLFDLVGVML